MKALAFGHRVPFNIRQKEVQLGAEGGREEGEVHVGREEGNCEVRMGMPIYRGMVGPCLSWSSGPKNTFKCPTKKCS